VICGEVFILGNRLTRALHGKVDVVNENDDDDDDDYVKFV
jgi:hypothetical protein